MELALLVFFFYATLAYLCGPLRTYGFILGTLLHGPLFLRRTCRPVKADAKWWSQLGFWVLWLAAFTTFTCAIAGVFQIHIKFFLLGITFYGYKYWDGSERTGERQWQRARQWSGWQLLRQALGHKIVTGVKDVEVPKNTSLLIACHNHGVLALSAFMTFMVENNEIKRLLNKQPPLIGVHWVWFWLPVIREFLLSMGAVLADRDVFRRLLLTEKRHICIIPEGTRDTVKSEHQPLEKQPEKRNGFIKIAFRERNATLQRIGLLNCEAHGEADILRILHPHPHCVFIPWRWVHRLRLWTLEHWQFAFPTVFVPGPVVMQQKPLVTVLGAIVEPFQHNTDQETIDSFEERYRIKHKALREWISVAIVSMEAFRGGFWSEKWQGVTKRSQE